MSHQQDTALDIYDMYVMDNSGVPIFAGCTVSDYCQAHADQHSLHTGFIAAMQSFGNEVFSGDLQNLTFPHIKILIHTVGDYYFVYVFPRNVDDDMIEEITSQAENKFKDKYQKEINLFTRSDEQFDAFVDDMIDIGLMPKNRVQSTKHYFVTDDGEFQEQRLSLIDRFKQKFRSLTRS